MAKKFDVERAKRGSPFVTMYNCREEDVWDFVDDYMKFCADNAKPAEENGKMSVVDFTPFYDALEERIKHFGYWHAAFWRAQIALHIRNLTRPPQAARPPIVAGDI